MNRAQKRHFRGSKSSKNRRFYVISAQNSAHAAPDPPRIRDPRPPRRTDTSAPARSSDCAWRSTACACSASTTPPGADRKRLITYVEIDRCATDAIAVVTGCRLGKRALKFRRFRQGRRDFCDLRDGRAVRVVALESARDRARELYPEIADKNQQQMRAYREMPDEELFAASG